MIKRYSDTRIEDIWRIEAKFGLWLTVELAVIEARELLGKVAPGTHQKIQTALRDNAIDVAFIDAREVVLQHDFNAFLDERSRFIPPDLQAHFHERMTSYDGEEAPFAMMLKSSCDIVLNDTYLLLEAIKSQAIKYRFTPMNARTHGQEAEMQSFGKRCLTWYVDLDTAWHALHAVMGNLSFSKLSGAIGTYSGIDPELEEAALKILGFKPWVGATQIMPRVLYAPIASALADIAVVIDKIATDIRLGARSGCPLWHEPFRKGQKGSSAMPHKKNTIAGENTEGMAQMARHYCAGIRENIKTWEERAIAQSSVERVFWSDLFHVTLRAIKNLTTVMNGLTVFPDNMMAEILQSRGCYASNEAKELLVKLGLLFGLNREESYRLIQVACFNAFSPTSPEVELRRNPPGSREEADRALEEIREFGGNKFELLPSIQFIVVNAELRVCDELGCGADRAEFFNAKLRQIFGSGQIRARKTWNDIFKPSHILANEDFLFRKIFGV